MELSGVAFREDEEHRLHLVFSPGADARRQVVQTEALRALADGRGYAELAYDEAALRSAAAKIRDAKPWSGVVARRSDAAYAVEIASDKMSAWLTVSAACGGKPASALEAVAALGAHGIKDGVDAAAVERAVRQCGQRQQVATGSPAQPGSDGALEALVEVNPRRQPQVDERGQVDLHDLGAVPTVEAGQALMRRHPPRAGTAGRNVLGETVAAPAVKDVVFAPGLQGVGPADGDPDLLVAQVTGRPVLLRNGIAVEAVVCYQDIDISVGNVQFPGSVEVRGDVCSGMRIEAGGDVIVRGVIEYADVRAGGNVRVQGGIIGHSDAGSATHESVRISAGGSVSAKFVESSIVQAEHAVHIQESIVHSEVSALDEVVVGAKGRKGRIIGGKVRASRLVAADYVGGEGSGRTQVLVGINPLLRRKLDEIRQRLDAKLKQHDDVSKVVRLLRDRPEKQALHDKACSTLQKLAQEIGEETAQQRALEAEAKLVDNARIVVRQGVYAGVIVSVGRRTRTVPENLGRGAFVLDPHGHMDFVQDPAPGSHSR